MKATPMKFVMTGVAILTVLFWTSPAKSQKLDHLAEFWALSGDVQFLPGAYVVKYEDGKTERYSYKDSGFEPLRDDVPPLVRNWTSFDWSGVDFRDQINGSPLDPDVRALVPKQAKIKKIIEISLTEGGVIALVCYTLRTTEKFTRLEATDIFVAGAINADPTKGSFRKLWDIKVKTNSDYGDFQYQSISGVGSFILLYSATTGGDASEHVLNIYRLAENVKPESLAKRKQNVR
jgi:hypothetical protein